MADIFDSFGDSGSVAASPTKDIFDSLGEDKPRDIFDSFGQLPSDTPATSKALAQTEQIAADYFKQVAPDWNQGIQGNALRAARNVAAGFIPRSVGQAVQMVLPPASGVQDIGRGYQMAKDVVSGTPVDQAVMQNSPEAQAMAAALKTPPFSQERFEQGFGTAAQLAMGAGIVHWLKPSVRPVESFSPETATPARPAPENAVAVNPEARQGIFQGVPEATQQPERQVITNEEAQTQASQAAQAGGQVDTGGQVRSQAEERGVQRGQGYDEVPLTQQEVQPLPPAAETQMPQELSREQIVAAANKMSGGEIVIADSHPNAWVKAKEEGIPGSVVKAGFVTNTGKFLTRADAVDLARKVGQPLSSTVKGAPFLHSRDLQSSEGILGKAYPKPLPEAQPVSSATQPPTPSGLGAEAPAHLKPVADALGLRYDGESLGGTAHQFTDLTPGKETTLDLPKNVTPEQLAGEFGKSRTTPDNPGITSIKNAVVDRERAFRGLPPAMEVISRDFSTVREELLKKIDTDPAFQDNLIAELLDKPRAIDDLEDAALLHRQVDLQNEFEKTANDLIVANESNNPALAGELNLRTAQLSDRLLDVYNAGKTSGTATARGLNARKMLAAEDFSLASMITKKRAALKGRPLTPEETADVGRAHQKIKANQIAYDAYETSAKAEAYRKRLRKLAEQYGKRTAAGDFAARPRKLIPLDKDAMLLKADVERAKQEFQRGLIKDRLQNRTSFEKMTDGIAKWRRTFVLTWPTVLAKLTTASGYLTAVTPLEEAAGLVVGKVLPRVAAKAPRYGSGLNIKTEAGAITHTFKTLFKAAGQKWKTGSSDIDLLYGNPNLIPHEFKDYVSHLHGALKEPARQNEFFRSFQQRLDAAGRSGADITDPLVQTKVGFQAYKDANRQIFMDRNMLAEAFDRGLRRLTEKDKATGKVSQIGKAAETATRFELPIIRIPLNIVKRTFEYSFGVPTGAYRLARAMVNNMDHLAPEEADLIIRNIRRGSIGMAAVGYGYFHPEMFGGYYQHGEKRSKDDVKVGGARIAGVNIPPVILHNPWLAQLQIGSTIRRVSDSFLRKKDMSPQGYAAGVRAAYSGVVEEVPFVRQAEESLKALDPRESVQFAGELLKAGVPGAVEWTARYFDKDAQGNPIARRPETILQYPMSALPGLRGSVPEKSEPVRFNQKLGGTPIKSELKTKLR